MHLFRLTLNAYAPYLLSGTDRSSEDQKAESGESCEVFKEGAAPPSFLFAVPNVTIHP